MPLSYATAQNSIHLGDGAYATLEVDRTVTIWCDRENGVHHVNLDQTAIENLEKWYGLKPGERKEN